MGDPCHFGTFGALVLNEVLQQLLREHAAGSTQVRLYCSSASQYNWLKAYDGQEVTVEIAACNWNSKNYYVGCVLAVVHADGTKTLNTLNFS